MTKEEQKLIRDALVYGIDKLVSDAKYCPYEHEKTAIEYDLKKQKLALIAFDRTFEPPKSIVYSEASSDIPNLTKSTAFDPGDFKGKWSQ